MFKYRKGALRLSGWILGGSSGQAAGLDLGIIDMLQTYDTLKFLERGLKLMSGNKAHGISSMGADGYADRFLEFACGPLIIIPGEAI